MARVLTLLFEVTALFDMQTRLELVMLQKTMVVVEGVARKLDPRLNMWTTAEPVVGDWIAQNLGPLGRLEDARDMIGRFVRAVAETPKKIERFEAFLAKMEKAAEEPVELSTAALWVIAISLILIAVRLYLR